MHCTFIRKNTAGTTAVHPPGHSKMLNPFPVVCRDEQTIRRGSDEHQAGDTLPLCHGNRGNTCFAPGNFCYLSVMRAIKPDFVYPVGAFDKFGNTPSPRDSLVGNLLGCLFVIVVTTVLLAVAVLFIALIPALLAGAIAAACIWCERPFFGTFFGLCAAAWLSMLAHLF
jgi:hypothetical protein